MANNHATLTDLFTDIANAIRSKRGVSAAFVADKFPEEILAISTSSGGSGSKDAVLESVTVTPTGETFTVTPDRGVDGFDKVTVVGDPNLDERNIAEGVTIYGKTGTLKVGAASSMPSEYESFVEHAKTLYTGDYANIAILESNNILNVVFLMDDFKVLSYNEGTTEFTAIGWLYCEYTKATQTWRVVNYTTEASTGVNYVKHIRYSSVYWEYNGQIIWPVGMSGGGGGGAGLNIAYGDTAPEDTTKLWVKAAEPSVVKVTTGMSSEAGSLERLGDLSVSARSIPSAAVGKKIYLFGGSSKNGSSTVRLSKIDVYDSEKNTIATLGAALPSAVVGHACAAVGTKVYIFGGYDGSMLNRIDIFDAETETIQTCSTTMPSALSDVSATAVGTKIYILGGSQTAIYEFDTETETIRTHSVVMPVSGYGFALAAVGTKVYIFGGYASKFLNTIYEFDTVGNKIAKLGTTLPISASAIAAATFGTKVYLFGGGLNYNGTSDTIIVFDAGTGTLETLETTLPTACCKVSAAVIGAKVYLFGGEAKSNYLTDIYCFVVTVPLDYGTMILQYTTGSGLFPIVNSGSLTIELCPASVHIGDASGAAQLVEAFTYKDGAWTAI